MKTIIISDESYNLIKNQLQEEEKVDINELKDLLGKSWFFRTVTYHLIGKAAKIIGNFIQLENASWIADSGRFMNAIKDGKLNEVEPVGNAWINITTVTDFFEWKHELPDKQI